MSKIYIYVVDRDYGFAPNPFHGYCTLATCKPRIRHKAEVKDWVIGVGGSRLKATARCIYAMCITEKITFNEYWSNPKYFDKKPVRNGSRKMMVGDNIYHYDTVQNKWYQADSHHSNDDGSVNLQNLTTDTKSNNVLISRHFFYFGKDAPLIPINLLDVIGYKKNQRNYRVFQDQIASGLIDWLYNSFGRSLNQVIGDPFDFNNSEKRYSP
ncbi:conserved hypothetical protein (plasmid) [Gloeothece citriformis PCC 7424]|uniref:Nucleotide modification associated domain-containing protein n=1 Tax=Gloeothece citriformis (strain PCC 7424) TaxID=65393 RepID=B7KMY1_GLOC7|nr:hypothetical protein [Gloeothece citriformis]ACK74153.1 conserved hypothetical protein [Gloeothece citriformis PCC 7424]